MHDAGATSPFHLLFYFVYEVEESRVLWDSVIRQTATLNLLLEFQLILKWDDFIRVSTFCVIMMLHRD